MSLLSDYGEESDPLPSSMPLPPEQIFSTRENLHQYLLDWSRRHGFCFRIGRSTHTGTFSKATALLTDMRLKLTYECTRCGPIPSVIRPQDRKRSTSSSKTGCQFSITAIQTRENTWELRHRPDSKFAVHNHGPALPAAFAVHRRFDAGQLEQLQQLYNAGNYILSLYMCLDYTKI